MTPAELITRKLKSLIESSDATLDVISLLIDALEGKAQTSATSFIAVNCHVSGQVSEPLPLYTFDLSVDLVCALDDDKSGTLFKTNYDALWDTFDTLCRGDNCTALGDEDDDTEDHVFSVDGFQLGNGESPAYDSDSNGGVWTCSFAATITGRAPSTPSTT